MDFSSVVTFRQRLPSGSSAVAALNGGYHAAFLVGALFAAAAAVIGAVYLRPRSAAQGAGNA